MEFQKVRHTSSSSPTKVIQFLNANLRQDAGYSIREEYPSLFRDYPGGESLFIEKGGEVASHVGILCREFLHPTFRMKIGLIGSVVTGGTWKNQGLATGLIQNAISELKRRGCLLCVLWSDDSEFYAPFGFHRAGREKDYRFSSETVPPVDSPSVAGDVQKHAHLIWRWYLKNELRVDRSLEEQKRLCSIPQTKIFVTEVANGISSYIAIQKGADFANYIHEWGGEPQALQRNIAWVQKNIFPEQPLTLISPAHYDLGPAKSMAIEQWDGVLGLVKSLDVHNLMVLYLSFIKAKGFSLHWDRTEKKAVMGAKEIPLETEEQFLKLIFGAPEGSSDPHFPPPLPFFLWGYDSI